MNGPTLKARLHFRWQGKGRKRVKLGKRPDGAGGRIPRISRLMALAIPFDRLFRDGSVALFRFPGGGRTGLDRRTPARPKARVRQGHDVDPIRGNCAIGLRRLRPLRAAP